MSGGKAHGRNRAYQVQCRDVLVFRRRELTPFCGDGIDVPFHVGATTWTLDVALCSPAGDLVVAECRRRKTPIKQEEVAGFAYKVELLRKHLGVPVAGVFVTKSAHQIGAVKVGQFEGITMAGLVEGSVPPGFAISFHRYDIDRERRCKDVTCHVEPLHMRLSDTLELKLFRRGGGGERH